MVVVRLADGRDMAAVVAGNVALARETEGLALDDAVVRRGVQAVLDDPAKGFYLVAEVDGAVVGRLMITYEWSDWRCRVFWWIQSVYVDAPYRGRGVFRALYNDVLRRGAAVPVAGLRLYVDAHNAAAKAVYAKLGFAGHAYDMLERDFVIDRPQA